MATKITRTNANTNSSMYYDANNALIILKNSTAEGKVPAPSDLEIGELALSLYVGEESIWAKNSEGNIVKLNSVTKDSLWEKDFGVFLCYASYAEFQADLIAGSINEESIVFISDSSNRGIWTQGTFYKSLNPDDYYTKEQTDEIFLSKEEAEEIYITGSDVATQEKAGLMSAEDKIRLDSIYDGDQEVTAPKIKGEWKIYNNDEIFVYSNDTNKLYIEDGYKVQWEGTFKWVHTEGYKDPVGIGSESNWNVLPPSGENSYVYDSELINASTEISIELIAPKTGLTVDERNSVISAEGLYDSAKDMVFVKFMHRVYYGNLTTNEPTSSDILGLSSQLIGVRGTMIPNVNCGIDEYYVYAYPEKLGELRYIRQDGFALVTGAFELKKVTVTNVAGYEQTLNVYITNNPGAFTNSSLEFK